MLFCVGSDMCPFGSWSSLRCGGFLTGIMFSALFYLLYAIRHMPFCNGLRQVPSRCLVLALLRRPSRGHPALCHNHSLISNVYSLSLLYAIRHRLYAVFADHSSRVTRHCLCYSPYAICHRLIGYMPPTISACCKISFS